MKSKGINLIELVLVIGIIGIIASIGAPIISRFLPSMRLTGATKELVMELRRAQQYAVTEQIIYQIRFYENENKYQLIKKTEPEELIKETGLPETIAFYRISFSPPEVDFNPAGIPSGPGEIELINQKGKKTKIEINPVGFIKSY